MPKAALNHEAGPIMVDRDRVGAVGLQFNRIRTGLGRRLEDGDRALEAAVMIGRQLCNDVGRLIRADPTSGDFESHVDTLPGWIYQSAISDGWYPALWNRPRLA